MRNLEDCKAEVFRRSEERIKERKRSRNRGLACCIPLCLLLVAGGVYIRPLLEPVDEMAGRNAESDHAITDRELGGLSGSTVNYAFVELMVRNGDTEVLRNVTDADVVEALCLAVTKSFRVPTAGSPESEVNLYGSTGKYKSADKPADYRLVFQTEGGEKFVYRLYENVLYDDRNACSVTLTDTQLAVLKSQIEAVAADEDRK